MRRKLFFLVLFVVMLLSACGGEGSSTRMDANATPEAVPAEYAGRTNPFGSEAADEGGKVFKSNCATCHGDRGHGDGLAGQSLDPKPKDLAELQKTVEDDYLFWRTSEGKPGTSMVGWKGILSEEQVWQVVSFMRTLE